MASLEPLQNAEANVQQLSFTGSNANPPVSGTSTNPPALAAAVHVSEPTGTHGGKPVGPRAWLATKRQGGECNAYETQAGSVVTQL